MGGTIFYFHRSPDWEIWPNYGVVECQPRSWIATVIDSISIITTIIAPPAPTVLAAFIDSSISLLRTTTPPISSH